MNAANARLVVSIDTEEEGLWGGKYPRTGNTTANLRGLNRFQELCDRYGVLPTYLIDAPVLDDSIAVEFLRTVQDDGRGEVGAHLHPWCNPPFQPESAHEESYLCNLPEKVQREKLTWLTEAIEAKFGTRPTSFRAGRYGLDHVGAGILRELGYLVDSSVTPFIDRSNDGGPNFESATHLPYLIDASNLCTPATTAIDSDADERLLEVPVSLGYSRPNFEFAHRVRRAAMHPWLRRMRAVGIADRLGIARLIKFSPEQASAERMRQLIDAYRRQQAPVMVLLFHSTSLMPGFSPYVRESSHLEEFFNRLEKTFEYSLDTCKMEPVTLTSFAIGYRTALDGCLRDQPVSGL